MADSASSIRWFSELGIADVPQVGGKNASLGEMVRELAPLGVRVPNGFAITAGAYHRTLDAADAWPRLHKALSGLDPSDVGDLARRAQAAREIVCSGPRCRRSWPPPSATRTRGCAPSTATT
jgi:pyruvate,water dikinase